MFWVELYIVKKADPSKSITLDFKDDGVARAVGDYIINCDDKNYVWKNGTSDQKAIETFIKYFGDGSQYEYKGVYCVSKYDFASEPEMYEDDIAEFLDPVSLTHLLQDSLSR